MAASAKNMWQVRDLNATAGPRTHVIQGTSYHLSAESFHPMSQEHAAFFLKDEAFQVKNAQGEILPPMPKGAVDSGKPEGPKLAPGTVIANLEELTREALYARARALPGRDAVTTQMTKPDLIEFLRSAHATDALKAAQIAEARENVADDELTSDEMDKMLPSVEEVVAAESTKGTTATTID